MKRTIWFVGLLGLLIAFGAVYSLLHGPDEERENRLVGALGFIEEQIEDSSVDILDANPFISPTIDSGSTANTFRIAGRVKILSRDDVSGLKRHHVEPYHAVVQNLCKPYAERACWRLQALKIGNIRVAADPEPINAPEVERPRADESPVAPHRNELLAALPSPLPPPSLAGEAAGAAPTRASEAAPAATRETDQRPSRRSGDIADDEKQPSSHEAQTAHRVVFPVGDARLAAIRAPDRPVHEAASAAPAAASASGKAAHAYVAEESSRMSALHGSGRAVDPPGLFDSAMASSARPAEGSDRAAASADDRLVAGAGDDEASETFATVDVDEVTAGVGRSMRPLHPQPQGPGPQRPAGELPSIAAAPVALERERPAERPLTKSELRELEQILARLGFYPGPSDGALDHQSEEAIRAYQDFAALPNDGVPRKALLVELRQVAQLADDRALALADPAGEARLPTQVIPPRKPEWANLRAGDTIEQAAAGTDVEPLPIPKPRRLADEAESRQAAVTPVAFAIGSLSLEAKRAIQAGRIDVRLATGHTPLITAILKGQRDAVAALLHHGADPNLPSEDQATALMYAAWAGDADCVRLLLEAGADPDRKNLDRKTALMAAAATGHAEIVALLLENGAAPDLQALKGWTALMYAVWRDQQEVVRLLLRHGANILIPNSRGETAVDLAAEREHSGIRALLVNASGSS